MANLFDTECGRIVPNIKCVIFSILMALMYWYLPTNKVGVAISTIFFTLAIGWYRWYYSCENLPIPVMILAIGAFTTFFYYVPKKNPFILIAILYFSYILQAWWDYFFSCQYGKLSTATIFPFGKYIYLPFKDPDYKARYEAMCADKKNKVERYSLISGLVILGIAITIAAGYGLKKIIK